MSQTTTVTLAPSQPDISYHPSWENYIARRDRRVQTELLARTLPTGFPAKLHSPLVWEDADFKDEAEWTLTLKDEQWVEIEEALAFFKGNLTIMWLRNFFHRGDCFDFKGCQLLLPHLQLFAPPLVLLNGKAIDR